MDITSKATFVSERDVVSSPWLCVEFQGGLTVAEGASGAGTGMDDGFCQPAGEPFEIDLEAASGEKAGDFAVRPGERESGQQMDKPQVALQQHLGDAGRAAEIAIDLERRMGVPQIVQSTVPKKIPEQFVGSVSVIQSCPLVQFPAHTPACGPVSPMVQGDSGGLSELGSRQRRQSVSRMKPEQVVDVPVMVIRIVYVL